MLRLFGPGLTEDERCRRAFRAVEVERVATEACRATNAVIFDDQHAPGAAELLRQQLVGSRVARTIAGLNLMGIATVLPGEPPFDTCREMIDGRRIYLRASSGHQECHPVSDRLDALSGLIDEFRRSTIFVNGLRIEPAELSGAEPLMLVAAHAAIMVAFGEFLARKYVIEGWSLC